MPNPIHPIFPIPLLSLCLDKIDDSQISEYKDFLNQEKWFEGKTEKQIYSTPITKNQQILDEPIFTKLSNTIKSTSKKYLEAIGKYTNSVQIVNSWGVKTLSDRNSADHTHDNSFISGVFYLTEGPPINLHNINEQKWWIKYSHLNSNSDNLYSYSTTSINPKPKLLIIFPSWLPHGISSEGQKSRLSISFNIIPKGDFGINSRKIKL